MKTRTSKSFIEGLLNRDIILSKNGILLTITTQPAPVFGCGGSPDTDIKTNFTTSYGLKEFENTNNKLFYNFFLGFGLGNMNQSTIDESNFFSSSNSKVNFIYSWITNIESQNKDTTLELNEIREILENSRFK